MVTPGDETLGRLEVGHLSILVERDGAEMFRSTLAGVRPLLQLVDRFPEGLAGATIADRVVGGCAARVFVLLRPARVLALVGSVRARAVMDGAGIAFRALRIVPDIRNRTGTDTCPFEQLGRHFVKPERLIAAMRRRLAELSAPSGRTRPSP